MPFATPCTPCNFMNLWVFSCQILPLWGGFFALYFILRREGLARQSLIAKCGGSFLAVGSAGSALYLRGINPFSQPVFWFFLLCTAADALLEIRFVAGMLVFGAAHICLVIWLWEAAPPSLWSLCLWVLAYACTAFLFRRELPKLGKLTVPFCLYPGLLGASLALALPLPFLAGPAWRPAAIGALCFFVSDMMVAKGELSGLPPKFQKPVMLLYWAALYLLSWPLWAGI